MTPTELRDMRRELDWSQEDAAARLGLGLRGYRYNEGGVTSRGIKIPLVPRSIAVAMLAFRLARRAADAATVLHHGRAKARELALTDFLDALEAEAGPDGRTAGEASI